MPAWKILTTDLQGADTQELLHADDRKFSFLFNRVDTAEFKIPLGHAQADLLLTTDRLVKVYRDNVIRFNGPIITAEESGDSNQTVSFTASSPLWRLSKRLIGKERAGVSFGTTGTPMDRGTVVSAVLNAANATQFTGVWNGVTVTNTLTAAGPYHFKPALEIIADLATTMSGLDFRLNPSEPANVGLGWPSLGTLVTAPSLGVARTNAIFEYGTTKANVKEYKRSLDRSNMLTTGYILASGWPDGTVQVPLTATSAEVSTRGLFEDVVPDGGVTWDALRQALVDEHVLVRKNPRHTITFVPFVNAKPAPFSDYDTGDQVRCMASVNGQSRFDGMFRVWGMVISIDKNGNESVELELVAP